MSQFPSPLPLPSIPRQYATPLDSDAMRSALRPYLRPSPWRWPLTIIGAAIVAALAWSAERMWDERAAARFFEHEYSLAALCDRSGGTWEHGACSSPRVVFSVIPFGGEAVQPLPLPESGGGSL